MFPEPEGLTLSYQPHLLTAQAFIPPTERVEVAGFDFPGDNFDIRDEVLRRINDVPEDPSSIREALSVGATGRADHLRHVWSRDRRIRVHADVCRCADRPIRARHEERLDRRSEARARCCSSVRRGVSSCHAVPGRRTRCSATLPASRHRRPADRAAGRQRALSMGLAPTRTSGWNRSPATRMTATNSAPRRMRNVALQPAFFHNGAFTTLEDAVTHHLDVFTSMRGYDPARRRGGCRLCAYRGAIRAGACASRSHSWPRRSTFPTMPFRHSGRLRPTWAAGSTGNAGQPAAS